MITMRLFFYRSQVFINLKVAPIRGVVTWAEINYEELPEKVKDIY